jgi:hypothetical protein
MKLKVKHFPVEDRLSFALLVTVYFDCASEILLVLGTSAVYWVDLLKGFEETLYSTFHKCLLPNCCSFGCSVSEKTFLEINQSETRIACGSHVC